MRVVATGAPLPSRLSTPVLQSANCATVPETMRSTSMPRSFDTNTGGPIEKAPERSASAVPALPISAPSGSGSNFSLDSAAVANSSRAIDTGDPGTASVNASLSAFPASSASAPLHNVASSAGAAHISARPADLETSVSAPPASGSVSVPNMQQIKAAGLDGKGGRKRRGTTTATSTVSRKKQKTVLTPPSIVSNVKLPDGCPEWAMNAFSLLGSSQLGPEWDTLLTNWLNFESVSGFQDSGKLAARRRPQAITDWIARARIPTYQPDIKNIARFANDFSAWWQILQPSWRVREDEGDWAPL